MSTDDEGGGGGGGFAATRPGPSDCSHLTRSGGDPVPVLLVTANVGSIFEDPDRLIPAWRGEMLARLGDGGGPGRAAFVAIHFQEVRMSIVSCSGAAQARDGGIVV